MKHVLANRGQVSREPRGPRPGADAGPLPWRGRRGLCPRLGWGSARAGGALRLPASHADGRYPFSGGAEAFSAPPPAPGFALTGEAPRVGVCSLGRRPALRLALPLSARGGRGGRLVPGWELPCRGSRGFCPRARPHWVSKCWLTFWFSSHPRLWHLPPPRKATHVVGRVTSAF